MIFDIYNFYIIKYDGFFFEKSLLAFTCTDGIFKQRDPTIQLVKRFVH